MEEGHLLVLLRDGTGGRGGCGTEPGGSSASAVVVAARLGPLALAPLAAAVVADPPLALDPLAAAVVAARLPLALAVAPAMALALLPTAAAPVALALLPVSSSCCWQRVAPVALVPEQDPDQAQQRFQGASGPSPVFEGATALAIAPLWFGDLCMHPLARATVVEAPQTTPLLARATVVEARHNAVAACHDAVPAVGTVQGNVLATIGAVQSLSGALPWPSPPAHLAAKGGLGPTTVLPLR